MSEAKTVCGNCNFCVKDDGEPYCVMKDLYTTVGLEDECDEFDIHGNKYFAEEKKIGGQKEWADLIRRTE